MEGRTKEFYLIKAEELIDELIGELENSGRNNKPEDMRKSEWVMTLTLWEDQIKGLRMVGKLIRKEIREHGEEAAGI